MRRDGAKCDRATVDRDVRGPRDQAPSHARTGLSHLRTAPSHSEPSPPRTMYSRAATMTRVEAHMRALLAVFVLTLSSSLAFAQQPPASAASSRTYVSAADVTALIAKAKADRKDQPLIAQSLIQLAPYNVSLEYRASVGNAAVHETEAELFYVVDGSATLVTGGKLTGESRTNAENLTGNGIKADSRGTSRRATS